MNRSTGKPARKVALAVAITCTVLSVPWTLLFFLQPWRSCLEDDSSAGCVPFTRDLILMFFGVIVFILGAATITILSTRKRASALEQHN